MNNALLIIPFFVIRPGNWDLDRLSRQDFFSLAYMTADRYMFDPTKHIGGFGMVIDMGGMTSKQMTSLSDRKHNKFSTKIWQVSCS
ncbi:unnamed protein product [Protopolystoma xenopodis]|uniref:CRAL-TRIO domain-containing protein n=1 Tax=Protopolystoma xenopodis TaxID=117903 RepID=A0A3S5BRE1_9PLAT|nr:unnamed protein product [Protopolystoma xenopodis]